MRCCSSFGFGSSMCGLQVTVNQTYARGVYDGNAILQLNVFFKNVLNVSSSLSFLLAVFFP